MRVQMIWELEGEERKGFVEGWDLSQALKTEPLFAKL